jgi:thymidylate synthase
MLTQRSGDFCVGCCANIQFYSALIYMLAQQCGLQPYEFVYSLADAHCYSDQIPMAEEYLARPKPDSPKLILHKAADIYSYKMEDFEVVNYNPLPAIKIPVAV